MKDQFQSKATKKTIDNHQPFKVLESRNHEIHLQVTKKGKTQTFGHVFHISKSFFPNHSLSVDHQQASCFGYASIAPVTRATNKFPFHCALVLPEELAASRQSNMLGSIEKSGRFGHPMMHMS